jgi:hypothetical protein
VLQGLGADFPQAVECGLVFCAVNVLHERHYDNRGCHVSTMVVAHRRER